MALFEDICKYSTPDDTDTDCPVCRSKNSLSRFERSRFPVSIDDKLMYTPYVLWYGCRICTHRYVDSAFQKEYDATVLALTNRIKDDVTTKQRSKITTLRVIGSFVIMAIAIYGLHKFALLMAT